MATIAKNSNNIDILAPVPNMDTTRTLYEPNYKSAFSTNDLGHKNRNVDIHSLVDNHAYTSCVQSYKDININKNSSGRAPKTISRPEYNDSALIQQASENWASQILCDMTGFLYVLSPSGKILYCSESCIHQTGFQPQELVGRFMSDFIHTDDLGVFVKNLFMAFQTLSKVKIHYRFIKRNNDYLLLETVGHTRSGYSNQTPQAFFATSQPYQSSTCHLFDSILELKMENEWLKNRLCELSAPQKQSKTLEYKNELFLSALLDKRLYKSINQCSDQYSYLQKSPLSYTSTQFSSDLSNMDDIAKVDLCIPDCSLGALDANFVNDSTNYWNSFHITPNMSYVIANEHQNIQKNYANTNTYNLSTSILVRKHKNSLDKDLQSTKKYKQTKKVAIFLTNLFFYGC